MGKLEQLTKRQKLVYDFIRDKILNRGYGPTVREIGENFGISSPNGVMCHLKACQILQSPDIMAYPYVSNTGYRGNCK